MKIVSSVLASVVFLVGSSAFASDANNAARIKSGLDHAKAVVDRAIRAVGGSQFHTMDVAVVGDEMEEMGNLNLEELPENDSFALPILIQASSSLGQAATLADQAKLAYLSGNIAFGNYRFSVACSRMGISRSQIARANTAALQPPAGFLAAFGPDLAAVVIELNSLRASEGCP